jgi:hypothetical protein
VGNAAVAKAGTMKQYVGLVRDHSGSMSHLSHAAMADYNTNLQAIKDAAVKEDIDTILNVVAFEANIELVNANSSVSGVKPITSYSTLGGNTPLIRAINKLITVMEAAPDANDPNVSFLVMVTTDGQENVSLTQEKNEFAERIRKLQSTDHWTFTFRTPAGGRETLQRLGIPASNVEEWEQTERGLRESSVKMVGAVQNFYGGRARGMSASTDFYADASKITPKVAKQTLTDISGSVRIFPVDAKTEIQPFFIKKMKYYVPGTAFYQLTKTEKAVQSYKGIIIRSKKDGSVYAGKSARDLLGIPSGGTIKLTPGDHGDWDIFIQSVSNNRLLIPGTSVVHWSDGR